MTQHGEKRLFLEGCAKGRPSIVADGADQFLTQRTTDGITPLMLAVQSGNLYTVAHLIHQGADLLAKDSSGNTVLDYAKDSVTYDFLKRGGNFKSLDIQLIEAIKRGDMARARQLYDQGASITAVDSDGKSALEIAARQGNADAQRILSGCGSVNIQMSGGQTPLMMAASMGSMADVRHLIESGADLNMQDEKGETALMKAAQNGHGEATAALIEAGADPLQQDNNGRTVLHHMAEGMTRTQDVETVFNALDKQKGILTNLFAQSDNKGNTLLHTAAQHGNSAVIDATTKRLSADQQEAALSRRNNDGQTPLDIAFKSGDPKAIESFFKNLPEEKRDFLAKNYLNYVENAAPEDRTRAENMAKKVPGFWKIVEDYQVRETNQNNNAQPAPQVPENSESSTTETLQNGAKTITNNADQSESVQQTSNTQLIQQRTQNGNDK